MQKKELTQANANPYMRPMGRSSLISASAPLSPVMSGYTPNEPENEEFPFVAPLTFAAQPPVEEIVKREEEETQPAQTEEPLFDASPSFRKELPAELSAMEKDPSEEAPARFFVELPQEQPSPSLSIQPSAAEEEKIVPLEEELDYAAAYAQSLAENQEQDVQQEAEPDTAAAEATDGVEPLEDEAAAEETESETDTETEEETSYEYDPAYYAAYWQQWQAAMEAHQAATCSACPLMNGQRGKVCLVPVIIPDQSEEPLEPKAIFTMMEQTGQKEEGFLAASASEESTPTAEELPMKNGLEEDEDDEDFFGEDVIASENMPKPQTVPVAPPQIGETKKGRRIWPWVLLAVLALAGAGLLITSKLGVLEEIVNWLGLPQSVVDVLDKAGLL